ncbi:hypothetical protein DYBT9275_05768 [Dyadobacter sp. CECT 9275]|uniref:DUF1569 domain-containing protein n=1 Tax=Dyadobacter helix TaxID=2822344 RepID=A0A916JIY6_9BACT|nr:DUF1569 domain-containing protein [Dyadobacter sp. CECT 9275]CAG5017420.1 hypothetical protein DYBT9275_05768 [Dyadobacter sp. CECT 9275]
MALPNIFSKAVTDAVIERINKLTKDTIPEWGKMTAAQMLAHCCVSYEYVFDNNHKRPGALMRWIMKSFLKNAVVGEKPYQRNSPTASDFRITDDRDFALEKERLISYLRRTQELGADYFDGRESHSFGKLNITEWNNMFYKHLDHHLTQFRV